MGVQFMGSPPVPLIKDHLSNSKNRRIRGLRLMCSKMLVQKLVDQTPESNDHRLGKMSRFVEKTSRREEDRVNQKRILDDERNPVLHEWIVWARAAADRRFEPR